ncbi:MAG: hypothetical protein DDT19_00549 [Syntrophomonadaceae bacterium]|nr:hypothetical protein [Bacillota bacterium]
MVDETAGRWNVNINGVLYELAIGRNGEHKSLTEFATVKGKIEQGKFVLC